MTDKLNRALVLVTPEASWVQPEYDFKNCWNMADGEALRALYELLGDGSQACVFHSFTFGNGGFYRQDHELDYQWHEEFHEQMAAAFGEGNIPHITVQNGHNIELHGDRPDREYSNCLYGGQTKLPGMVFDHAKPSPIRIFDEPFWVDSESCDPNVTARICRGIIRVLTGTHSCLRHLNNPAISLDESPRHFRIDVASWLRLAEVRSGHYERIAVINEFVDKQPVISEIIELQAAAASNR